jgi:cell division protein FtsB
MLRKAAHNKQTEHDKGNGKIGINAEKRVKKIGKIHADHQELALAEIDDLHDSKDYVLSHAHKSVKTANKDTVNKRLYQCHDFIP